MNEALINNMTLVELYKERDNLGEDHLRLLADRLFDKAEELQAENDMMRSEWPDEDELDAVVSGVISYAIKIKAALEGEDISVALELVKQMEEELRYA